MNFISPNTAAQYNVENKIKMQNIQVIQKKLYKVIRKKIQDRGLLSAIQICIVLHCIVVV